MQRAHRQCHHRQRGKWANSLCLGLVALCFLGQSVFAAEPWPIKEFQVVAVEPSGNTAQNKVLFEALVRMLRNDYVDVDFPGEKPDDKEGWILSEIEGTLYEAAVMMEAAGLPPPALDPVITREDGTKAYRVYLVDALTFGETKQDASGVYHPRACETIFDGERVIILDRSAIISELGLSLRGAQTVVHELFHAVQANSPLFDRCDQRGPGSWITEGMARAVGWIVIAGTLRRDTALDELQHAISGMTFREMIWSVRNYRMALPIPSVEASIPLRTAYRTASFWMYLAEIDAAGKFPPTPGLNDYSLNYLSAFLNAAPSQRDCHGVGAPCESEIIWLDGQVREVFGEPLREVYARFIQAYALYGEHRITAQPIPDEFWLRHAFEDCNEVLLRPEGTEHHAERRIRQFEPIAAQCFDIVPAGFDETEATLVVTADVRSGSQQPRLTQLTASVADGSRRLWKAKLDNAPGDRQHVTWEFKVPVTKYKDSAQGEQAQAEPKSLFLLTNVADLAYKTQPFAGLNNNEITLTFTVIDEFMSMGESNVDGAALADAINTPLPIELDTYRAVVQTGLIKEKVDGNYIGTRHSEGIVNPCLLHITGNGESRPDFYFKEMLGIYLQTSGAISPGRYPITATEGTDHTQAFPDSQAKVGALLYDMPENHNDLAFEDGVLTIQSVSGGLVRGYLKGLAVHREYSTTSGKEEITDSRTLSAKFSIRANGEGGRLTKLPYACLSSGK